MAASTRTSISVSLVPPTRLTRRSWRTRSSLTCSGSGSSPISSSRIVEPCAASNIPWWARTAPVNAPFSWPNSSLSMSASGMAPQLTTTSGLSARGEL